MKHFSIILLLAAAVFPLFAAEENTFEKVRSAVCPEGKADELRSASIVYQFSDEEMQGTKIIIHAKAPGKIRLDTICKKEFATYCIDGSFNWKCDSKTGIGALTPEELLEFRQDLSIFPVKIKAEQLFVKPEKLGEEMRGKTPCTHYQTSSVKHPELKIDFWLSDKTNLPKQIVANDLDGSYKTMFRDYRNCDGINVASRINLASDGEFYTLRLVSVEWNKEIPDDFFSKPRTPAACLKAAVAVTGTKVFPELTKGISRKDIRTDELEQKIRSLTIKIQASETALQKMENAMATNQKDAVALAAASSYSGNYRSVWNRHGFSCYRRSGGTKDSTTRRKAIKQMGKANEEMAKEYENIAEDLLKMQVELSDAKAALARLNPDSKYAK